MYEPSFVMLAADKQVRMESLMTPLSKESQL